MVGLAVEFAKLGFKVAAHLPYRLSQQMSIWSFSAPGRYFVTKTK